MAKHVKRSVIPIYLVGVVWLVFGLGLRLYQPVDYILCALVSVAAFVVGKAIFPDKSYQIAGGEDEEEKEREAQKRAEEAHAAREKAQAEREERQRREQEEKARQAQQAKSTGNPEIDKLILERERALSEMRRLNDSIEDETISAQIDHLEEVTAYYRDLLVKEGFDIIPGTHPCVPVMIYDEVTAAEFAERMRAKGVYVVAFSYPVVPKGKARIRTQVCASHTKEDIDFIVKCFKEVRAEMGL